MTFSPGSGQAGNPFEFMPVYPVRMLMENLNRQEKLAGMQYWVSVSGETWHRLYEETVFRYARYVQELPDPAPLMPGQLPVCSRLLDNALQFSMYALKLRKACLLPRGADPEEVDLAEPYWTYAVFTAALLQGLGNKLAQLAVILSDAEGLTAADWDFRAGPMPMESYYVPASVVLEAGPGFRDVGPKTGRSGCDMELALRIIPERGRKWLTYNEKVYAAWAQYLETGGREGDLAFITQPAAGSENSDAVEPGNSKRAETDPVTRTSPEPDVTGESRNQVARSKQANAAPGKPSRKTVSLLSQLQDKDVSRFLIWLNRQIADQRISVNAADGPVQSVSDGILLVLPELFDLYRKAGYGQPDLQRRLLQQKLHVRNLIGSEHLCHFEHRDSGQFFAGIVLKNRDYLPAMAEIPLNRRLQRRFIQVSPVS